jgi:hypothetical protein
MEFAGEGPVEVCSGVALVAGAPCLDSASVKYCVAEKTTTVIFATRYELLALSRMAKFIFMVLMRARVGVRVLWELPR